jgi:hypothetical protein
MGPEIFDFKPAPVPQAVRGRRTSRYTATVEAVQKYLDAHPEQPSVKLELGSTGLKAASASFRKALSGPGSNSLRLVQRGGELYIARS